ESTTYPGTTEEVLRPILEQSLGQLGKDFYLAYSPEREDPGNPLSNFDDTPKVVAGSTKECQRKAIELYSKICSKVVPVSSCTMAEMVKIWENTFRAINISAVNELKMVCDRMNLDVWEVVEAAKTKPYGFTPFYPGPGMGGHCIPVDPFYLSWKAKEFGIHTRFIELAGEINFRMHHYVANKVIFALNDQGKSLKGAKILIVGLAYKANIDDIRESPSLPIISTLQKEGAQVDYHDPHVPIVPPIRHFQSLEGKRSLPLNRETITHYDLCLILTQHDAVPYELLAAEAVSLVDTRNAMANFNVKGRLYKA
ncbi:MAG: nucleotide sugar dehydrogenase, partial [Puniceicoccales bacterium]|nr:nucleotide sugar dehydrogenase [Puniceicoccales bacterium]